MAQSDAQQKTQGYPESLHTTVNTATKSTDAFVNPGTPP